MGIPGLTTQLATRGRWITMEAGQQQQQTQQTAAAATTAIVDGPGLAYYVYKELCIEKAANSLPAYSECASRTVRFLDEMEAAGLPILAIFFDGVLPAAKMPTRKERLQRKIDQLRLARSRPLNAARLPEPPFLVPAALEAIRLAYRMLMPTQVNKVEEFTRSNTKVGSHTHVRKSGWSKELETHLTWFESMINSMPEESTLAQRWYYMGVGVATSYLKNHLRQGVSVEMVVRMLIKDKPTDWTEKHVEAMVQAAVYSIRMLKQLLALEKVMNGLDGKLEELNTLLEEMPGIAELFERGEQDTREFWEETAELLLGAA